MSDAFNQIEFPIHYYWGRYRRHIQLGIVIILALWFVTSILYVVDADEEGVVLRFGEYLTTTQPGLHAKLPWPIETVDVIPVQKIQSIEFARAAKAQKPVNDPNPRHESADTIDSATSMLVNAKAFAVDLAPGSGSKLRIHLTRYANKPSYNFPWNR